MSLGIEEWRGMESSCGDVDFGKIDKGSLEGDNNGFPTAETVPFHKARDPVALPPEENHS